MKRIVCAIFITLASWGGVAFAETNFDTGITLFSEGDYAEAVAIWTVAAEDGDAFAKMALGEMYKNGFGVEVNMSEAFYWYLSAAEQGLDDAQNEVGLMYEDGIGVLQNYAEALRWYGAAAKNGNVDAQLTVGFMNEWGHGTAEDVVVAHAWYNIAALNGNLFAGIVRDKLGKTLTFEEIGEAQDLAMRCVNSGYTDCEKQ